MIFELSIKDFILIGDVKIRFDEGLNIMTGETGAGKSMVLGAIDMVLGAQANKDSVRLGAEKAQIRASFHSSEEINAVLESLDIPSDDEVIILSREVHAKGKSYSRINGQVVTLSQLKTITDQLLSVHGQNEHQRLLYKDYQMDTLDAFGGESLLIVKEKLKAVFNEISGLETELSKLAEKSADRSKQLDFLNFQIQEIEASKLKADEDLILEREFEYLSHLEAIKDAVEKAVTWMSGDYGEGAIGELSQIGAQIRKLEDYSDDLKSFSERFQELFYLMDDLGKDIGRYHETLETDPEKFMMIEHRLDEINHLKSKYGKRIPDILDYLDKIKAEKATYDAIDDLIVEKREILAQKIESYDEYATLLTTLRKKSADTFEKMLEGELQQLNMKTTSFKIDISKTKGMTVNGMDDIEFMISTNVGQPFRPMKKVVSGGELSRIMLGIKIVLGRLDSVPTLVFDEVDAGISGVTANIVGEKLAKLAGSCQIICITHLPQIAVYSDHHFLIEKYNDGHSTETLIRRIEHDEIESEISRLVGGVSVTEATLKHSREMIIHAKDKKNAF